MCNGEAYAGRKLNVLEILGDIVCQSCEVSNGLLTPLR